LIIYPRVQAILIMETDYKTDFEKFLAHTNEKKVLLAEIVKEIKSANAKSLLDIGAGNGLMAIPLSKQIEIYIAVESKPKFIEKLKEAGINAIEGLFPINIDQKFDMALSCHAISYKEEIFVPYIQKAMDLLNPNGRFVIVTFRGQEDEWTQLLKDLGIPQMDYNRVGYNSIIEFLHTFGDVLMKKVTTTVDSKSLEDMVDVLSFVYHGGNTDQKVKFSTKTEKLKKILNAKYKSDKGYRFPFQHLFITTKKDK
jgi:SAM-dependent methyltransferase